MYNGQWEFEARDRKTGAVLTTTTLTFSEALAYNRLPGDVRYKPAIPEFRVVWADFDIEIGYYYITKKRLFYWFPELERLFEHFTIEEMSFVVKGKDGRNDSYVDSVKPGDPSVKLALHSWDKANGL